MHIIILDENGEVLKDVDGNDVCFYNITRPSQIFESYVKPNFPEAVSWKEKLTNDTSEDRKKLLRERRNKLLNNSDWTQISDSGLTEEQKQAWRDYRQALRDLPETEFIGPIIWPTAPNGSI